MFKDQINIVLVLVGSVFESGERHIDGQDDRYGRASTSIFVILLHPLKRHFRALSYT